MESEDRFNVRYCYCNPDCLNKETLGFVLVTYLLVHIQHPCIRGYRYTCTCHRPSAHIHSDIPSVEWCKVDLKQCTQSKYNFCFCSVCQQYVKKSCWREWSSLSYVKKTPLYIVCGNFMESCPLHVFLASPRAPICPLMSLFGVHIIVV